MGHFIDLDEAVGLGRNTLRQYYSDYVNPGRASLIALGGFDRNFVRALGTKVWDDEGHEYLDFLGGYGSLILGHNNPEIWRALDKVKEQPNLLQASIQGLAGVLAYDLAEITPGDLKRSFFANSGAEAVEGALKLARAATGRQGIVYCDGSYHGKTMGALAVTGREKYQEPFRPLMGGVRRIPFGDAAALDMALQENDVAAFIVEPIQGEQGVILPPPGYLQEVRKACDKHGTLLILDEVQTGLARTGAVFACEHEGVVPDILCLAKALGGGIIPFSAFITRAKIWDKAYGGMERALLHTSTFGGNTMGAAAGIATLSIIRRDDLARQAREKGTYFLNQLNQLALEFPTLVKEVRGRGLLIGMEFQPMAKGMWDKITAGAVNRLAGEYIGALINAELLARHRLITAFTINNPGVIRLAPPAMVTEEEIDQVVSAFRDVFVSQRSIFNVALSGVGRAVGNRLRKG